MCRVIRHHNLSFYTNILLVYGNEMERLWLIGCQCPGLPGLSIFRAVVRDFLRPKKRVLGRSEAKFKSNPACLRPLRDFGKILPAARKNPCFPWIFVDLTPGKRRFTGNFVATLGGRKRLADRYDGRLSEQCRGPQRFGVTDAGLRQNRKEYEGPW